MTIYTVAKLIHIVAAIVAVGTNVTYFVWLSRVRSDPQTGARILPGIRTLDARLANPAYVVLPIAGVVMVLDADLGFTTFWIITAIVLYVAVAVIGGALFAPALRRQAELATTGADPTDYELAARRTVRTGVATMIPVAVILYLMVIKPTP